MVSSLSIDIDSQRMEYLIEDRIKRFWVLLAISEADPIVIYHPVFVQLITSAKFIPTDCT